MVILLRPTWSRPRSAYSPRTLVAISREVPVADAYDAATSDALCQDPPRATAGSAPVYPGEDEPIISVNERAGS
ncbi:hypothetical protein GCM10010530_18360 [Kribbella aluminosa]